MGSRWWLNAKEVCAMPTWMCFLFGDCRGLRQVAQQPPCPHAPVTTRTNCLVNKKQDLFRLAGSTNTFNFLPVQLSSALAIARAFQRGTSQGKPPDGCKPPFHSLGHSCCWGEPWRQLVLSLPAHCQSFLPVSVPKKMYQMNPGRLHENPGPLVLDDHRKWAHEGWAMTMLTSLGVRAVRKPSLGVFTLGGSHAWDIYFPSVHITSFFIQLLLRTPFLRVSLADQPHMCGVCVVCICLTCVVCVTWCVMLCVCMVW